MIFIASTQIIEVLVLAGRDTKMILSIKLFIIQKIQILRQNCVLETVGGNNQFDIF